MINYSLRFMLLVTFCAACSTPSDVSNGTQTSEPEKKASAYLRWVGDTTFDAETDNPDFKICHGEAAIRQYFNFSQGLQYEGEKQAIADYFAQHFKPVEDDKRGWIRIRFIVNCKGETGWFRMISSDYNYNPVAFNSELTDQLLTLTKNLNGWKPQPDMENAMDYYQYLTFKIEDGQLLEILP